MNTIKLIICFIVAFLCHEMISAQHTQAGRIMDMDGTPIPFANVSFLSSSDSTQVFSAVTDSIGRYSIILDKGEYVARYSFLGYDTLTDTIKVCGDSLLDDVTLRNNAIDLEGVEVVKDMKTFRLDGHSLLVDVENNNALNRLDDIYMLLSRIPGVLRIGESINVAGKGSPVYYINGKKARDQADVDNLPVEEIKTIKVVSVPDFTYDSDGAPVIEITTKRLLEGLALNVTSNLTQAKHQAQRHGFSSSYNKDKWDFLLGYYYNHSKSYSDQYAEEKIFGDTLWSKEYDNGSLSMANSHYYYAGMAYNFSKDTRLGAQYTGGYYNEHGLGNNVLCVTPEGCEPSLLTTNTLSRSGTVSHHANVYYEALLKNDWRLSLVADYVHKHSGSNTSLHETDDKSNDVYYKGSSHWNIISGDLNARHSFGSAGNLAFGYTFSHTIGTDRIEYEHSLSNSNTKNKETRNSLFINYDVPLGDFTLNTGLRYEYTLSRIKESRQDYYSHHHEHKLLPTLGLTHSSGMLTQNLSYSIGTNRPSYTDMNDNVTYTNRYTRYEGNTSLRTETTHDLSYMLMYRFLYFTLSYQYIHHPLLNTSYGMHGNESVTVRSVWNLPRHQTISSMLDLRHSIKNWTPSLTLVTMKSFLHYPGHANTVNSDGRPVVIATISNEFRLPCNFILYASYQHNFGGYLEMVNVDKYSNLSINVSKSFMKDKLRLSFTASDLFNGDRNHGTWDINNLRMDTGTKYETRKFAITLTYRFREYKKKNESNSAEKEMERLNMEE